MSYVKIQPIIEYKVRALCTCPYPNHPKGCPNYGKKESCPPKIKKFEEIFKPNDVYVIWTTFPFGKHVRKMKRLHPDWTSRQLSCCLYWQGTARKNLKNEIKKFLSKYPNYKISTSPEALGINVTKTMKLLNQHLEWPPKNTTYQVAIGGTNK